MATQRTKPSKLSDTPSTEPTRITATELTRNLSDILNRVRYRGESFAVERKGEVVAVLEASKSTEAKPRKTYTVGDFRRDFAGVMVPEGFGAAIEEGLNALKPNDEDPWQPS